MKKVYIDSDIILDLLLKRKPFFQYAAELFTNIEKNIISGYVSPLIFSNLYYIIRKLKNKSEAIKMLRKIKLLVKIVKINDKIIDLALLSDFNDFEDAIQYYSAIENNIDTLITRNIKDYKNSEISIFTAEEFISI